MTLLPFEYPIKLTILFNVSFIRVCLTVFLFSCPDSCLRTPPAGAAAVRATCRGRYRTMTSITTSSRDTGAWAVTSAETSAPCSRSSRPSAPPPMSPWCPPPGMTYHLWWHTYMHQCIVQDIHTIIRKINQNPQFSIHNYMLYEHAIVIRVKRRIAFQSFCVDFPKTGQKKFIVLFWPLLVLFWYLALLGSWEISFIRQSHSPIPAKNDLLCEKLDQRVDQSPVNFIVILLIIFEKKSFFF